MVCIRSNLKTYDSKIQRNWRQVFKRNIWGTSFEFAFFILTCCKSCVIIVILVNQNSAKIR